MAPLLLVFLAVADVDREPARVMLETAARAFGGDVRIAVERFEGPPPTLAALASAAHTRGATAAARVLWSETAGSRVSLDVYLARTDGLTYRVLNFDAHDLAAERGRAIGLVLAALVLAPEESRLRATEAPSPAEAIPARPMVDPATPADRRSPDGPPALGPASAPPAAGVRADATLAPGTAAAPGPWALEALLAAGMGLGASGPGVGGGVAVRRFLGDRWGARMGLQARTGSLPAAQASSLASSVAGSLFGRLRATGAAPPQWDVGVRIDLILGYEMVTHFSDDDPEPVRQGRFLPATAAWVEADWRIAPTAMLHAGAGMEIAAGTTHVVVRGVEVTRLSPVRAVGEVGFRLRF